ncbi:MAG: glycosyltransferase family 2 protein [Bacillota bacterium]
MSDNPVSIIIPAYNEENYIGDTISYAFKIPGVEQILVIDDGSSDNTPEIAVNSGAQVILTGKNRGKGEAINTGARYIEGNVVLILDADIGKSAAEAENLVLPVIKGEADMTVAIFPEANKKNGFGLVKGLARKGIQYFTGHPVMSPLSGQRAMSVKLFKNLVPLASGYGVEVDLTIRALSSGYRIIEIPVIMSHRETGRDLKGIIHRGKQFIHVARTLAELKLMGYGSA